MAVLDAGHATIGERVDVALADGLAGAAIGSLPIYDPGKSRPRA